MRILGIESSCDETAAAVVEADPGGRRTTIISSVVASQMATHGRYGGVVPELASREHLRAIVPVTREALARSQTRLEDLAAVAATAGPGLVGSLLVGLTYAKSLSFATGTPLVAVNHIEGHIHAVLFDHPDLEFPALALIASGGHTHLFEVSAPEARPPQLRYRLLGKTRDDAAGEAFDKVAKLLGFGYPGGPVIDRLAPYGNPHAVPFTFARMKGNPLDFSFSGLKTAVLRWVEQHAMEEEIRVRLRLARANPAPGFENWLEVTPQPTLDLVASFQHAVITELLRRAARAAQQIEARAVIISGGVASNAGLRAAARAAGFPYRVAFPSPALSTDNAAMIAAAAFPKLLRGEVSGFEVLAQANWTLA